jgi:hypothetical protein
MRRERRERREQAAVKAIWRLFQQISADGLLAKNAGPPARSSLPASSSTWTVEVSVYASWLSRPIIEFIGSYDRQGRRFGFPAAPGESWHVRIPPAAHT